jgi:hypothetical protein
MLERDGQQRSLGCRLVTVANTSIVDSSSDLTCIMCAVDALRCVCSLQLKYDSHGTLILQGKAKQFVEMGGGTAASSSSVHSTASKSHTSKQQPVQRTKPRTPIKKEKPADADDMSDENDNASSGLGSDHEMSAGEADVSDFDSSHSSEAEEKQSKSHQPTTIQHTVTVDPILPSTAIHQD